MQSDLDVSIAFKPHFTYLYPMNEQSLCQGDVLKRTPELEKVLSEVHPYFQNNQYNYFIVLTQSCDLVRRNGNNCKTQYITLAAVRTYEDFINKTVAKECNIEKFNDVLLLDKKYEKNVKMLLERVYNNTESEYFFLYKDEALNFPKPMVAYLKVSIALKVEHYNVCLNAKVLELTDTFKAKLGWLVGNMYSRVGTDDWEADNKDYLINQDMGSEFVIASKSQLKELKKEVNANPECYSTRETMMEYVLGLQVATKYDEAIGVISDLINTYGKISEENKTKLINSIKSNGRLKLIISSSE